MEYDLLEEKGRFTLRALLCFLFVLTLATQITLYRPLNRESVLYIAAEVLPTAVALWALHRGSWPGLVLFFIGAFGSIGSVTGALAGGGGAAMGDPLLLVDFLALLLRLTVIFCVFRSGAVGAYLVRRRSFRRRRNDVVEIGLFVLAMAFQLGVLLWAT